MREQERFGLATMAAEAMYHLWELENQRQELDLDGMMCRLKNLSAYSLTHTGIMDQCEGVELLALAMFFGATSNPRFQKNQVRLTLLSEETITYHGRAKVIEQEVARRKSITPRHEKDHGAKPFQPRLL